MGFKVGDEVITISNYYGITSSTEGIITSEKGADGRYTFQTIYGDSYYIEEDIIELHNLYKSKYKLLYHKSNTQFNYALNKHIENGYVISDKSYKVHSKEGFFMLLEKPTQLQW